MSTESDIPSGKRLKPVHLAWAAVAIVISVALVLVPQRGHPPPLALVPFVLLAWPIGHALIWGVGSLADKGRRREAGARGARQWPIALVIALIGAGSGSVTGLVQLLGSGLQGRWYPYPDPSLWTAMFLVWSIHGVCLVVLLLRNPWSGHLSAMLALGWAALLAVQLTEHVVPVVRANVTELALAIGLLVLLMVLAVSLVASRAVRAFLKQ